MNKRRTDAKGTKPNNYNTKKLRNTKSADNSVIIKKGSTFRKFNTIKHDLNI